MTSGKQNDIGALIRERFCSSRLSYDKLASEACEVVIFGSRAVGVHGPASDLDVLLVTSHTERIRASGLDFVLLNPEEIRYPFWLGSELASHIAGYGRWLKGSGEWRSKVRISDRAIARKQNRVSSVVRNAAQRWMRFHPVFRKKYAVTIRRELQRLDLLVNRIAIPPTPTIDLAWHSGQVSTSRLLELVSGVSDGPSRRLIDGLLGNATDATTELGTQDPAHR